MHVLGIDAGGTKTLCLLADEHGAVVAEGKGGGANLQTAGELEVEKVLYEVMESALRDHDVRLDAICLGIAGVDREQDATAVRGIMRRLGAKTKTLVVNDALIALVAGAGENPGVVIVAGTGSIAYGRDARGHAARAGGWGYLLGDEGSGFWIGRRALLAVVRHADGRGPSTVLTELVLRHMSITRPAELIHETYDKDGRRHMIAALATLVQQAQDAGDAVASDILQHASMELVAAAASVVEQLKMRGDRFPVILSGGIFKAVPWLVGDIGQRLLEVAPKSHSIRLEAEPALGAVRLALVEASGRTAIPTYREQGSRG